MVAMVRLKIRVSPAHSRPWPLPFRRYAFALSASQFWLTSDRAQVDWRALLGSIHPTRQGIDMKSLSKLEIEAYIPHRDPFLWIDEVREVSAKRIVARKFIDAGIDAFRGHYPGKPVFPGVLLVEAAMQAGGVLLAKFPAGQIPDGHVPVVTRINNVKFRRMVRPGDTLEIEVELEGNVANAFFLNAKVLVGGKIAVQFDYTCATAEVP